MSEPRARCAVIFNPVKVSATFREAAERALEAHGPYDIEWLETEIEDKGRSRARHAVDQKVDLVLVAGGDGTVRVVADGLAKSGIPLGIIPEGTANLLAHNLDIPNDEVSALEVAVAGQDRTIDLVKLTIDGERVEHFAVMAGAGFDAMIMDETDPSLKAKIGTAAYFLAIGKAMGRLPIKVRVRLAHSRHTRHRSAILILIGNVGKIKGITLFPDALPDDGRLDLMLASPRRWYDWFRVLGRLITRRPHRDDPVEIHSDSGARIRIREREQFQLDGDVEGDFLSMDAEVVPRALTVRVPA